MFVHLAHRWPLAVRAHTIKHGSTFVMLEPAVCDLLVVFKHINTVVVLMMENRRSLWLH